MYDAIMGVGRSPQITSDIVLNPYSLGKTDISEIASLNTEATNTDINTKTGNIRDIINENFDSSSGNAYSMTSDVEAAGTNIGLSLILDFQKVIYVHSVEYKLTVAHSAAAGGGTHNPLGDNVQFSNDGVNWSNSGINNYANGSFSNTIYQKKFRFVKFSYSWRANSDATSITLSFNYIRILIDNIQY